MSVVRANRVFRLKLASQRAACHGKHGERRGPGGVEIALQGMAEKSGKRRGGHHSRSGPHRKPHGKPASQNHQRRKEGASGNPDHPGEKPSRRRQGKRHPKVDHVQIPPDPQIPIAQPALRLARLFLQRQEHQRPRRGEKDGEHKLELAPAEEVRGQPAEEGRSGSRAAERQGKRQTKRFPFAEDQHRRGRGGKQDELSGGRRFMHGDAGQNQEEHVKIAAAASGHRHDRRQRKDRQPYDQDFEHPCLPPRGRDGRVRL